MKKSSRRWLLVVIGLLAFVLAACSTPRSPQPAEPENQVVELDGFKAQIETSKLDLAPLSLRNPPKTTYCGANVAYTQVVVPMLGLDQGRLSPYVDVFWMPRHWNRKLALYAHGYIAPGEPDFLQQIMDPASGAAPLLEVRDRLLCEGYALGASSFAAQGYAVQQGIAETHLMNAVFPLIFWRRPSQTYVFGSSLGGLITTALAELFPRRYDGAMPTCGPLGGSLAEFSYVGNARLLFDTAFPGVLQGTVTDWVQDDTDPTSLTYWPNRVGAAIIHDSTTLTAFTALANTKVNYTAALGLPLLQTPATYGDAASGLPADVTAVNALLHALRYSVEGSGDAIERGGGSPFSNVGVSYQALVPAPWPAYVDPRVTPPYGSGTFSADARAVVYYSLFYQPIGILRVPTLSLHTAVDPDVPYAHELLYAALVASHPESAGMLHVFKLDGPVPADLARMASLLPTPPTLPDMVGYGHCNFLPTDLVKAFDALVSGNVASLASAPHFTAGP